MSASGRVGRVERDVDMAPSPVLKRPIAAAGDDAAPPDAPSVGAPAPPGAAGEAGAADTTNVALMDAAAAAPPAKRAKPPAPPPDPTGSAKRRAKERREAWRAVLTKTKEVNLKGVGTFTPTMAALIGIDLDNLTDEQLDERIDKAEKMDPECGHFIATITPSSWCVSRRPLRKGEKCRLFDPSGEADCREGTVLEDSDSDSVRFMLSDGKVVDVDRSDLVPEKRVKINVYRLTFDETRRVKKMAMLLAPGAKSRIQNLISYAGCCNLERDVILKLQGLVKNLEVPHFDRAEIVVMRDSLLVDFVLRFIKKWQADKYVYVQGKTDACAFAALDRKAKFGSMKGYDRSDMGIVMMSICSQVDYGSVKGRRLKNTDAPWHALPFETPSMETDERPRCSTFVHYSGANVVSDRMNMTVMPTRFPNNSHHIDAAFADPLLAIQHIASLVAANDPRIKTHSDMMLAEHVFAPEANTQRKEFVAIETFIHTVLARPDLVKNKHWRIPAAQNSSVDFELHASVFFGPECVESLNALLSRLEKVDRDALYQKILEGGEDTWIRVQFKSVYLRNGSSWRCPVFGKSIGNKTKGRYSRDEFDLAIFASFYHKDMKVGPRRHAKETISLRALWTAELVHERKEVFDQSKDGAATVHFHTKAHGNQKEWAWTLDLEEDAMHDLSVRFAKESDTRKDKLMLELFNESAKAGW